MTFKTYWVTFEEGRPMSCQGESPEDAKAIAEKVEGRKVVKLESLPYPASPMVWQFRHPVHGSTPHFCYRPERCAGRSSCQSNPSCTE